MSIIKRIMSKADRLMDAAVNSSTSMTQKEAREYNYSRNIDSGFYGHYKVQKVNKKRIKSHGGC